MTRTSTRWRIDRAIDLAWRKKIAEVMDDRLATAALGWRDRCGPDGQRCDGWRVYEALRRLDEGVLYL